MPTAWSGTDRVCTAREFGIPNVQMQSSPKGGPCAEYLAHVRAILLGWEVLNQGSQAIVRERQRSLGGRRVLVAKPFCMPNQISRCWIVPVAQSADIDLARRPACSPRAQCSACLILGRPLDFAVRLPACLRHSGLELGSLPILGLRTEELQIRALCHKFRRAAGQRFTQPYCWHIHANPWPFKSRKGWRLVWHARC